VCWRDIDIQSFKTSFIVPWYLICRFLYYQSIENKGLKVIKSVSIKLYAGLKLAVGFLRVRLLEEKPKCLWCPVFFMICLSL
jgi:hypothetical protein